MKNAAMGIKILVTFIVNVMKHASYVKSVRNLKENVFFGDENTSRYWGISPGIETIYRTYREGLEWPS